MVATKTEYNLNSADVAKMFGVTQKTIIRWANSGKFSYVTVKSTKGLRYKFNESEVKKMLPGSDNAEEYGRRNSDTESFDQEPAEVENKVKTDRVISVPFEAKIADQSRNEMYKELFLQEKNETRMLNEKLQSASYRIAQLEEQVKTRVSLIEHRSTMETLELETGKLNSQMQVLKKQLEREKIINISFFILSALIILEVVLYFVF